MDDSQCKLAIEKYDQVVRKNAPWFPSNIEFIRRINGLQSIEEVKRVVFEASYLVRGWVMFTSVRLLPLPSIRGIDWGDDKI